MKKKREFKSAIFNYNNLEDYVKIQDLKTILKSNDDLLIRTILEMIINQDLNPNTIDLILNEIVCSNNRTARMGKFINKNFK